MSAADKAPMDESEGNSDRPEPTNEPGKAFFSSLRESLPSVKPVQVCVRALLLFCVASLDSLHFNCGGQVEFEDLSYSVSIPVLDRSGIPSIGTKILGLVSRPKTKTKV